MGQGDKSLFFSESRKSVFQKKDIYTLINACKCMRRTELEKVRRGIGGRGGGFGLCFVVHFMQNAQVLRIMPRHGPSEPPACPDFL
jgi:hypothetical protein